MVFWIILVAVVLVVVAIVAFVFWDAGILPGLGTLVGLGIAGFMVMLIISLILSAISRWTMPDMVKTGTDTVTLQALSTGQATAFGGRFFLGTGYARGGSYQTFTYVYKEGEAFRLTEAPAYNSYVYEDEQDDPYVSITHWISPANPWIIPFDMFEATAETYSFHIPEGSVLGNYEVAP